MEAGIKVWMLTGDKGATAENIGKSCGIIDDDMMLLKVQESPNEDVKSQLNEITQLMNYNT